MVLTTTLGQSASPRQALTPGLAAHVADGLRQQPVIAAAEVVEPLAQGEGVQPLAGGEVGERQGRRTLRGRFRYSHAAVRYFAVSDNCDFGKVLVRLRRASP